MAFHVRLNCNRPLVQVNPFERGTEELGGSIGIHRDFVDGRVGRF
jgi:hypothetical protein